MVNTTILKGYRSDGQEVWAVSKEYGTGEEATNFVCFVEPTAELKKEYERLKNVADNTRKKGRMLRW